MNAKVQKFVDLTKKIAVLAGNVHKMADDYYEDCGDLDDDEAEDVDNSQLGSLVRKSSKSVAEMEKKYRQTIK